MDDVPHQVDPVNDPLDRPPAPRSPSIQNKTPRTGPSGRFVAVFRMRCRADFMSATITIPRTEQMSTGCRFTQLDHRAALLTHILLHVIQASRGPTGAAGALPSAERLVSGPRPRGRPPLCGSHRSHPPGPSRGTAYLRTGLERLAFGACLSQQTQVNSVPQEVDLLDSAPDQLLLAQQVDQQ